MTFEKTLFTAQEAREKFEIARSVHGTYLRRETDQILDRIELVCADEENLDVPTLDHVIRQRLEALGYCVTSYAGGDRGEESYVLISW